nr:Peptidyl-prolyl cis-trans isomerase-like 4 [Euglena gracilis]
MASRIGASVLVETTAGHFTIDLFTEDCPQACLNLLKLCKVKYFNRNPFHLVQKNFVAQCGKVDSSGGSSVWGLLEGRHRTFFADELRNQRRKHRRLHHDRLGLVGMANLDRPDTNASQWYVTLDDRHLDYLDDKHTIFGEVSEGLDTLLAINNTFVDEHGTPLRPICIKHTVVLHDPFPDPPGLDKLLRRSPSPSDFIGTEGESSDSDSELGELDPDDLDELMAQRQKESHEKMLELLGDTYEGAAPADNVLFVCKLNPVTQDDDLELIFSRFDKIKSCEIIRDRGTGESLCYAFIEFASREGCENAYKKMENVLIDDRRIHVDFSQSVAKLWSQVQQQKRGGKGGKGMPPSAGAEEGRTGQTLRYKTVQRQPDQAFVLDDAAQLHDAYELIGQATRETKRSRGDGSADGPRRNVYGDEEWSDEESEAAQRPGNRPARPFTATPRSRLQTPRPTPYSGPAPVTPRRDERHDAHSESGRGRASGRPVGRGRSRSRSRSRERNGRDGGWPAGAHSSRTHSPSPKRPRERR